MGPPGYIYATNERELGGHPITPDDTDPEMQRLAKPLAAKQPRRWGLSSLPSTACGPGASALSAWGLSLRPVRSCQVLPRALTATLRPGGGAPSSLVLLCVP